MKSTLGEVPEIQSKTANHVPALVQNARIRGVLKVTINTFTDKGRKLKDCSM